MTTSDTIYLQVPGKNGYEIYMSNAQISVGLEKAGCPTKYTLSGEKWEKKTQLTDNGGVMRIRTTTDRSSGFRGFFDPVIGSITPLEQEALSVIRELYRAEKNPIRKEALGSAYANALKFAKWGFFMDASIKDIPKVNE
jgi:hypothetical protein